MIILHKETVQVADFLIKYGKIELNTKKKGSYARSAVNGAYYAVFLPASRKMRDNKLVSNPKYELSTKGKIQGNIQRYWVKIYKRSKSSINIGKRIKQLRS